ncbi:hypothetical protein BC829DRAFT_214709 [Chytridium lagenaria]|nr:hypothetical protein BC829DRAFT_214709 [Chytridium lagenaria]
MTNRSTPEFYSCPDREACCPNGNCTLSSNCDSSFTGVLCTQCAEPNKYKWRGHCISCDKIGASLYLLFFLSFLSTFVVLFIPRHELPTVDLLFFFFQVIQLIFGPSIDELLGFGQLKTFLALTSLDIDGIAMDCPAKLSGVGKLLFRFLLPLAFFVNVGLLYMIFRLLKRAKVPVEKMFPYYMRGQSIEAVFFKALLSISTFALMPLVEASVALLDCRNILGSLVLYTDPTVECFESSHVGPVSFAILIIVLLLVVHPVALTSF